MTDEELTLYDTAMKEGRYLAAAGIVCHAAERQEKLERAERERESEEYYAKLRLERPDLFVSTKTARQAQ